MRTPSPRPGNARRHPRTRRPARRPPASPRAPPPPRATPRARNRPPRATPGRPRAEPPRFRARTRDSLRRRDRRRARRRRPLAPPAAAPSAAPPPPCAAAPPRARAPAPRRTGDARKHPSTAENARNARIRRRRTRSFASVGSDRPRSRRAPAYLAEIALPRSGGSSRRRCPVPCATRPRACSHRTPSPRAPASPRAARAATRQ